MLMCTDLHLYHKSCGKDLSASEVSYGIVTNYTSANARRPPTLINICSRIRI
jgi:hypothetical protein